MPRLVIIACLAVLCGGSTELGANSPSVLFLNIDDWNDWNSVLEGHPQAITPNLERFAERSVTFTRAICSSPVCFPSRTSLFTGLHPSRTGAKSNSNGNGRRWPSYVPGAVTLPRHLSAQGWTTVGIGKNFHNGDQAEFDHYTARRSEPKPIEETFRNLNPSGRWGVASVETEKMPDYLAVSQGIQALKKIPRSLFLSLGIYRPHVPWVVPQEYFDRHPLESLRMPEHQEDDLDDLPERFRTMAHNPAKFGPGYHDKLQAHGYDREKVQAYLACVSFADEQVGRILDAWYASPHAETGYVVLWSDHGYQLSEKEGWSKMKPWYDSSRVNLMIAGPGVAEGKFCDRAVSLLDLYPTLIDLLGLPQPKQGLDGKSLLPLLKDPNLDWNRPVLMSSEAEGIRYDVVLSNDYRMTRFATGETELYQLDTDPHEFTNLAEDPDYRDVIAELSEHLSLRHPQPDPDGWFEAESLPHQTSADFRQRGNYHYPVDRSDASGGAVVLAELRTGAGSYFELVVRIEEAGDYTLTLDLSAEGPCTLLTAPVVDKAVQADAGYPMKELARIKASSGVPFETVAAGIVHFEQGGLHLLRFRSEVKRQALQIDRLQLRRH